jgi:hypothetical protein
LKEGCHPLLWAAVTDHRRVLKMLLVDFLVDFEVDFEVDLPSLAQIRDQLPARARVVEVEVVLREAQLEDFLEVKWALILKLERVHSGSGSTEYFCIPTEVRFSWQSLKPHAVPAKTFNCPHFGYDVVRRTSLLQSVVGSSKYES